MDQQRCPHGVLKSDRCEKCVSEGVYTHAGTLTDAHEFDPDWRAAWTKEEAEHELQEFKFRGPGWYSKKKDWMLVLPSPLGGDKFLFYVYNDRNPVSIFNQIGNLPKYLEEKEVPHG